MGREIRRVPKGWEHPKDDNDNFRPLLGFSYNEASTNFVNMVTDKGLQEAVDEFGSAPDINDYMPEWTDEEMTHIVMYEDCSEGIPISPAFKTHEELARWLVDNKASSFGDRTATYEQWLRVCKGGFAPSAIDKGDGLVSGVEGLGVG